MANSKITGLGAVVAAAFLSVFLWGAGAKAATEGRVALIIGNSNYTAVGVLANPANDAADVAAMFGEIGFDVTHLENLDGQGMRRALRDFEDKSNGAAIAVVYYAGHGIEVDGVNYLIPVDASLERDTYVEDEAVSLSRVMTSVERATGLRLVLLDACRNNPFISKMERSVGKRAIGRGLARIEPTGSTLVAYSAKEGTTADDGTGGRNSPYAAALLAHLKTPGLEVNFLFRRIRDEVISSTGGRQEPFVYGSLGSTPIFFVPADEPETKAAVDQEVKPTIVAPAADMGAAYDRAERINTVDAWDAFLEFCNAGDSGNFYCGLARAARQKLVDTSSGSSGVPANAGDGSSTTVKTALLSNPAATVGTGDAAAECDRLAAHSDDADRPASVIGSALDGLSGNAARAIDACTRAVEDNPDDRRFAFQLGRAMHAGRRYDEAMTWYRKAADQGSAAAISNIGFMYASGLGVTQDYAEARTWYTKGADLGNTAAMSNLGSLYEAGLGVSVDYAEARRWYQKGSDLGNPATMNALAVLHRNGAGGPQDFGTARQLFEKAADLGDTEAMANLGAMYNYGQGVPVDYKEAWRLYDKAASLGNSNAMIDLALLYENGEGVNRDYGEARRWYEKAIELDNPIAMANLGLLYQNGTGVPQDYTQARKWYEKAAERGNAPAMANVGLLYENGLGVEVDLVAAREWYLKAAEAGNAPAMSFIGYMYANGRGGSTDYDSAREWYERGAALGNASAMTNLGFLYANGWGVTQNWDTGREWYEKGAEAGNAVAMWNLGVMYENGSGVAKDDSLAFSWYQKGADAGNAAAMASLAYFHAEGRGTTRNQDAAFELYTKAADLGNAMAMHNLGVAYQDGLGTAPNFNQASQFFIKAMQSLNTWTFDQFRDNPSAYPIEVRKRVQRHLIDAGYLTGKADGVMGPATKDALDAYQRAVGG